MTPEKAFKMLLIRHPFYGLFLLTLNKQYSERIPTLGVCRDGINVKLLINLKFWDTLTDDQQITVLLHECLHICLGHIFETFDRFNACGHQIANVAEDLEANSYLNHKHINEIGGLLAEKFGWEDKRGTKWYYEKLIEEANKQQSQNGKGDSGDKEDGESGNSNGSSDNPFSGKGKVIDSHEMWGDFSNLTDAEQTLIKNQIDSSIKATAEQVQRMRGTIPGELKEKIDNLFKKKPQVFNWKQYFRRLLGTQIDITLKKTYKRNSIRFPDSAGTRKNKKHSILVAIDTSGSVSNTDLVDFFSEIYYIWKAGANVKILEFDTKINKEYLYQGKCPELVTGRGGTDFDQAIEYYNTNYRDYSTFVMFSDGYAPINMRPRNNNIIWVLTNNHSDQEYPGKKVVIPKSDEWK